MSDNPLFDLWKQVFGDQPFNSMERGYLSSRIDTHTTRSKAIKKYSFAVPSPEALELIASFGRVVEIGAGTGYWAKMLRGLGIEVVAYDIMGKSWSAWFDGLTDSVLKGDASMAAKHPDKTLLLVWPPYSDSMAYKAAKAYRGERIIYVGEGDGGCTADDEFFELMGQNAYRYEGTPVKAEWQEVKSLDIPQWDGLHDYLTVFERLPK